MSIHVTSHGDFKNVEKFLKKASSGDIYSRLDQLGKLGVDALRKATPRRSGETAQSWGYKVIRSKTNPGIEWTNDHVVDGANIAILIQYGHGTGTGGYVQGIDYINPAMRSVFEKIAEEVWEEVRS